MDYIRLNYDAKCHLLAEKFSPGNGRALCGLVIENGITGGTSHWPSYDGCARCAKIFENGRWY